MDHGNQGSDEARREAHKSKRHHPTRSGTDEELRLRHTAVTDGDRLVGMITDRDIAVRCIAEGKGPDAKVRDAMTEEVKYCFEDEDVSHVCANMSEIQVRRLPVMDRNKRFVGIVSLSDLVRQSPATGTALHGITQPSQQHNQSSAIT
jgi:CBS domain-containing protein